MIFKTHRHSGINCSKPLHGDGSFTDTAKIALAVGYHPGGVTRRVVHAHLGIPNRPGYFCHLWVALRDNGVIKYDRHTRKYTAGINFQDYQYHMHDEFARITRRIGQ